MTKTARALITQCMGDLGVVRPGQHPSSDQLAVGLVALNELIESFSIEKLLVFQTIRTVVPLSAGGQSLSVSAANIDRASLLLSGATLEVPFALLEDDPRRSRHAGLYSDGGYPVMSLRLSYMPAAGDSLVLYLLSPLTQFVDLDTSYDFPAGYGEALHWSLDEKLAASTEIVRKAPANLQLIQSQAIAARRRIKNQNRRTYIAKLDNALLAPMGTRRSAYRQQF